MKYELLPPHKQLPMETVELKIYYFLFVYSFFASVPLDNSGDIFPIKMTPFIVDASTCFHHSFPYIDHPPTSQHLAIIQYIKTTMRQMLPKPVGPPWVVIKKKTQTILCQKESLQ